MQLLSVLWQYRRARKLGFSSRAELEGHQALAIERHLAWVASHSPYYRKFAGRPLAAWPLVDKHTCLTAFDTMNTAGLRLEAARNFALAAEASREFSSTLHGLTIGLSSGTSGTRGLFVANARERALWAGLALSRLLPDGLFGGERIAFFLRANSTLYTAVQTPWISFKFFDLMAPLEQQLETLQAYQPSVIVAPAQVLRHLALKHQEGLGISPKKVISVAEVLEFVDKELISQAFPQVAEVYQATEGFLGYTCQAGRLHLNEEYLHIEPDWVDSSRSRMVPIITDFSRTTQPIIRYRLNDVLAVHTDACPCGNPSRTLSHIEGRCDDQLLLPGQLGPIPVFSDALSRALLRSLPFTVDYRLTQTGPRDLSLMAELGEGRAAVLHSLNDMLRNMGVDADHLRWTFHEASPPFEPGKKRRRIVKEFA